MSARTSPPIKLKPKHKVKDDKLSPSSLELYDLMYLETCVTAEAVWCPDWTFCPVCMARVESDGVIFHKPRQAIEA